MPGKEKVIVPGIIAEKESIYDRFIAKWEFDDRVKSGNKR